MSNFIRKLRKKLQRKQKGARMGYIWAREQEKAKRQHYHLLLLLDQHTHNNPRYLIHDCIEPICEAWEWPKPYTPKNCYSVVKRDDSPAYADMFYRASYLCKARGKGYKDPKAKDYEHSRIKPKAIAFSKGETV